MFLIIHRKEYVPLYEGEDLSLKERLAELQAKNAGTTDVIRSFAGSVRLLDAAITRIEVLSHRVVEKAETSSMSVSDRSFSSAEQSKYPGSEIQQVLTGLLGGNGGIEGSLDNLVAELRPRLVGMTLPDYMGSMRAISGCVIMKD